VTGPPAWIAPAAAALLALLLLPGPLPAAVRRLRRPLRPVRADVRRRTELEWVEAVAAETGAGRDPASAVVVAVRLLDRPSSALVAAAAAAASQGDVVAALRSDAAGDLLLGAAACWEVAAGSGAGLAASLGALADAAREDERVRRELQTGLAEPRATALVLAALPVVGLLLGAALGTDPASWLLGTSAGLAVLAGGVLLEVLGALWSWRIVRSLEAGL
jgi:tight adherence protein B